MRFLDRPKDRSRVDKKWRLMWALPGFVQVQGDPAGSRRWPRLEENEVHVWCAAIDLPGPRVQALEKTLTPDELSRASGFRFTRDRDRFVAARGILRAIVARYLDASPDQLRFRYGPYGKPALTSVLKKDIRFNVAHAHDLALYALAAGREIGIDLERVRPHAFDEQIAAQRFSVQENAVLRVLPPRERQEAFFRFWTRKEAYVKARGGGLSMFPAHPGASLASEPMVANRTGSASRGAPQSFITELDPAPGYVAALAVEGEGCRLMFRPWPF